MNARRWPFPGDAPIVRARKMALAYRQHLIEEQKKRRMVLDVLSKIDERIIGWMDDDTQAMLKSLLGENAPDVVAEADERFYEWGEQWHTSHTRAFRDDEWITSDETATILCVVNKTVNTYRSRGRLEGKFVKGSGGEPGRWYFNAGEVYALMRERQRQASQEDAATDTIQTQGRSDAA